MGMALLDVLVMVYYSAVSSLVKWKDAIHLTKLLCKQHGEDCGTF